MLATLAAWLAAEWAFDCIVYPSNPLDTRQAELLRDASLQLRLTYTRSDGQPWHVYG